MGDSFTILFYEMLAMTFFSYGIVSSQYITLAFLVSRLLSVPYTGGHTNPAVTLTKLILAKISFRQALFYWLG